MFSAENRCSGLTGRGDSHVDGSGVLNPDYVGVGFARAPGVISVRTSSNWMRI